MLYISIITISTVYLASEKAYGETIDEEAMVHFSNGEYKEAIRLFDQSLENNPKNTIALNMKGIALSNLDYDKESLKIFFKVLQQKPNDATALAGMGLGFGNLGEYKESLIYFEKALEVNPDSVIIKNYIKIIEDVNSKYTYKSTEKPTGHKEIQTGIVPNWFKNVVTWWTLEKITDQNFLNLLEHMLENKIIQIPEKDKFENLKELKMLSWVKNNLNTWSNETTDNKEFFKSVNWLKDNNFLKIEDNNQKSEEDLEYDRYWFDRYLGKIIKNVTDEKRYIEYPNPSQDVIKKFLRDNASWNFEEQVKSSSQGFPDPTYEVVNEVYNIKYKIYVNPQPVGLPLNHIETLEDTFKFWGAQELKTNNQNAKVVFEITKSKADANVWITWVVRDIGEGVLGHAHLGKGIVEVALGSYGCDGSFQLFDVESVKTIMTHEIGHSIGLPHTSDRTNIMYPSYTPSYAYCLLE